MHYSHNCDIYEINIAEPYSEHITETENQAEGKENSDFSSSSEVEVTLNILKDIFEQ